MLGHSRQIRGGFMTGKALLMAAGALITAPSYAQSDQTSGSGLEEIVVTAQRRAENLQRVPISVTTATGAELATRGITDSMRLAAVVPGITIRTNSGSFQPSIRGIGTPSNVVESPVALYIDGVYFPQQREGLRQFTDIAQIAVLKGPQGTLFGRNATGGVIQITTLAPTHEFSGTIRGEIDNYATLRTSAYVTGGLTPTIAASVSLSYAHQGQGWGENLSTGRDTNQIRHDAAARIKLLFEPGPNTSATLIADYTHRSQIANGYRPYPGTRYLSTLPQVGSLTSPYDNFGVIDGLNKFKGGGVSLTINQDMSWAKLVSISSFRENKALFQFDNLSAPARTFDVRSPNNRNKTYSQELQLVSPSGGGLDWTIGVFYFHNDVSSRPINRLFFGSFYSPLPTSVARSSTYATERTESVAPFAQATYEIFDRTKLTLGARYTYEKRSLKNAYAIATRNNGVTTTTLFNPDPLTIKRPTFRVALDHRFTDQVFGYASFNTGIKSGGFSSIAPANPPYNPEKLTAYEAGIKTELFDRRLRFNIGGFYYDYANVQVIQFVGIVQTVVNGASARLYGLDVDYQFQINDNWRLSGGAELESTKFTDYRNAVFTSPLPNGGATVFAGNATGNRLPLAQKLSATAALDYNRDVGQGAINFNLTANYNSGYYFEADNFLRQGAYTVLNSSVQWSPSNSNFSVGIFGRNLLNEHVITQATSQAAGYPVTYGFAPRTYGVQLQAKF